MIRRLAVVGCGVLAWAVAGKDRMPLTLSQPVISTAMAATGDETGYGKNTHDLSAMRIANKVLFYVKDYYVDPKRIKPKEMLVAGLEAVEKSVPDVLVEGTAESQQLVLTAGDKKKELDISRVDSLWKMSTVLKDAISFLTGAMRPVDDSREVEYAMVNSMLQTLDPHSVFLKPEFYRDMKTQNKGEFGGLGFVIQMKEGNLTVVRVLPKTPAFHANIKKDDQIIRIGEESTVNMDTNEAVSKLRGKVDTKVNITIARKSWEKPQTMTLTRGLITVESSQSKLLSSNVGYVRLKSFQGNTTRDLETAIADLTDQTRKSGASKLAGLVLDLRGNPGGLLDQAIQVSDVFVSNGTIVSTVGMSDKMREEKRAHQDDDDNAFPVAVLMNSSSASASEIVAGALKNLNRAVIIGRQSFGKGSVQVLYDFPEDSALKLTIAKYLTPGDISIQEIGITPDIELVPTRVSKNRIDLFAPKRIVGEADLGNHFGNPNADKVSKKRADVVVREKPVEILKFLRPEPESRDKSAKAKEPNGKDATAAKDPKKSSKDATADSDASPEEELDDQLDAEAQDEIKEDFEVTFARDFLLAAPFTKRTEMLAAGKKFVAEKRDAEEVHIANALTALGVEWNKGAATKNPQLFASLKPSADKKVLAGEPLDMELTVENRGADTARRVRAWTESDNAYLDRREFVFGQLKPGEKKSWSVKVKMPKVLMGRRDAVTVKLQDDYGILADTSAGEVSFVETARPQFAFNWSISDDCSTCNGDGLVQRGETVSLLVDVTNVGTGKALGSFGSIRNASDSNIFIEKGRFKLGELASGETKTAKFQFEVKKAYQGDDFAIRLGIVDEPLEEYAADKLVFPIAADAPRVEASKGAVRLAEKTDIYSSVDGKTIFERTNKPAVLTETGRSAGVVRVDLGAGRYGFVKSAAAKSAAGQKATANAIDSVNFRTPAQVALNVDPASGGTVVDQDKFQLSATVNASEWIDLFVMVNDQKVYFRNRPKDGAKEFKVTSAIPLEVGNNAVSVIVRHTPDFSTRKTVIVRRRPPAVAQTVTPTKGEAVKSP